MLEDTSGIVTKTDLAIARLKAIDWQGVDWRGIDAPQLETHVQLVRTYLKSAAQWADFLDMKAKFPFFDIAFYSRPQLRAPDAVLDVVNSFALSSIRLEKQTCLWYLHWCWLEDNGEVSHLPMLPDLPSPYEPLIALYEMGGDLALDNGLIEVSGIAMTVQGIEDYL